MQSGVDKVIQSLLEFLEGKHNASIEICINLISCVMNDRKHLQSFTCAVCFAKAIERMENQCGIDLNIIFNSGDDACLPLSVYHHLIHASSRIGSFCRQYVVAKHKQQSIIASDDDYTKCIAPILDRIMSALSWGQFTEIAHPFDNKLGEVCISDLIHSDATNQATSTTSTRYLMLPNKTDLFHAFAILLQICDASILDAHVLLTPTFADLWRVVLNEIKTFDASKASKENAEALIHCCDAVQTAFGCIHGPKLFNHTRTIFVDIDAFIAKVYQLSQDAFRVTPYNVNLHQSIIQCLQCAVIGKQYVLNTEAENVGNILRFLLSDSWSASNQLMLQANGFHILSAAFDIIRDFFASSEHEEQPHAAMIKRNIISSLTPQWHSACVNFSIAGEYSEQPYLKQLLKRYAVIGARHITRLQQFKATSIVTEVLRSDSVNIQNLSKVSLFTKLLGAEQQHDVTTHHDDVYLLHSAVWSALLPTDRDVWLFPRSVHKLMFSMYNEFAWLDHADKYVFRNASNDDVFQTVLGDVEQATLCEYQQAITEWTHYICAYFTLIEREQQFTKQLFSNTDLKIVPSVVCSYLVSGNAHVRRLLSTMMHTKVNMVHVYDDDKLVESYPLKQTLQHQSMEVVLHQLMTDTVTFLDVFSEAEQVEKQTEEYNHFVHAVVKGILTAMGALELNVDMFDSVLSLRFDRNVHMKRRYYFAVRHHVMCILAQILHFIDYFRLNEIPWPLCPDSNSSSNSGSTRSRKAKKKRWINQQFSRIVFSSGSMQCVLKLLMFQQESLLALCDDFKRNNFFEHEKSRQNCMVHIFMFLAHHWREFIVSKLDEHGSFDVSVIFAWFTMLEYPLVAKPWLALMTEVVKNVSYRAQFATYQATHRQRMQELVATHRNSYDKRELQHLFDDTITTAAAPVVTTDTQLNHNAQQSQSQKDAKPFNKKKKLMKTKQFKITEFYPSSSVTPGVASSDCVDAKQHKNDGFERDQSTVETVPRMSADEQPKFSSQALAGIPPFTVLRKSFHDKIRNVMYFIDYTDASNGNPAWKLKEDIVEAFGYHGKQIIEEFDEKNKNKSVDIEYDVKKILDKRWNEKARQCEFYIWWDTALGDEKTWEKESNLYCKDLVAEFEKRRTAKRTRADALEDGTAAPTQQTLAERDKKRRRLNCDEQNKNINKRRLRKKQKLKLRVHGGDDLGGFIVGNNSDDDDEYVEHSAGSDASDDGEESDEEEPLFGNRDIFADEEDEDEADDHVNRKEKSKTTNSNTALLNNRHALPPQTKAVSGSVKPTVTSSTLASNVRKRARSSDDAAAPNARAPKPKRLRTANSNGTVPARLKPTKTHVSYNTNTSANTTTNINTNSSTHNAADVSSHLQAMMGGDFDFSREQMKIPKRKPGTKLKANLITSRSKRPMSTSNAMKADANSSNAPPKKRKGAIILAAGQSRRTLANKTEVIRKQSANNSSMRPHNLQHEIMKRNSLPPHREPYRQHNNALFKSMHKASNTGGSNSRRNGYHGKKGFELDLFRKILKWRPVSVASALTETHSDLTPLGDSYDNVMQYKTLFEPFLLEETRAHIAQTLEQRKSYVLVQRQRQDAVRRNFGGRNNKKQKNAAHKECIMYDVAFIKENQYDANNQISVLSVCATDTYVQSTQWSGTYFKNDLVLIVDRKELLHSNIDHGLKIGDVLQDAILATVKISSFKNQEPMVLYIDARNTEYRNTRKECALIPIDTLMTACREYRVLSTLSCNPWSGKIICPKTVYAADEMSIVELKEKELPSWMRTQLNDAQLTAVAASLVREHQHITLIKGPPGTGKTRTIVSLINAALLRVGYLRTHQLLNNLHRPKILVCAPSNAAIDEVVKRCYKQLKEADGVTTMRAEMVRIGTGVTHGHVAHKLHLDRVLDPKHGLHELELKLRDLSKEQQETRSKWKRLKDELQRDSNASDEKRQEEKAMGARIRDMQLDKQECEQKLKQERERLDSGEHTRVDKVAVLKKMDVIFATLSASASPYLNALQFDLLIIDESTQANELSSLIPFQLNVSNVVMVGDDKQLPATVISRGCNDYGFSKSFFERCMENGIEPYLLSIQYRMHPDIRSWPSTTFYNNALLDGPNIATDVVPFCEPHKHDPRLMPYVFFDLCCAKEMEDVGTSFRNKTEGDFILRLLDYMSVKFYPNQQRQRQRWNVGIVTPYRGQVSWFRKYLANHKNPKLNQVVADTVESFQGQEKDIIIFSCVRSAPNSKSTNLGFLTDMRRLNVALTRAKYCCVIVGNAKTLQAHPVWKQLIRDAHLRGCRYKVGEDHKKFLTKKNEQFMSTLQQEQRSQYKKKVDEKVTPGAEADNHANDKNNHHHNHHKKQKVSGAMDVDDEDSDADVHMQSVDPAHKRSRSSSSSSSFNPSSRSGSTSQAPKMSDKEIAKKLRLPSPPTDPRKRKRRK